MTLLLGRISDTAIELGSDGLSISTKLANQPGRTTLQKLFPMEHQPIAVAQVGSNSVKRSGMDCSFAALVSEFFGRVETHERRLSVREVAEALTDWVISECKAREFVFILWVTGFDGLTNSPEVYCITLRKAREVPQAERSVEPVADQLIVDGSGKRFVNRSFRDLRLTFDQALARQRDAGEFMFGGHWHSLRIMPFGPPRWIRRPRKGTLGLDEFLASRELSIDLKVESPQRTIASQMKYMKNALFARARTDKGKQPTTIEGCFKNWERGRSVKNPPHCLRVFKLVAIGDDARVAEPCDVSVENALLYCVHVKELVTSLPPPLDTGGTGIRAPMDVKCDITGLDPQAHLIDYFRGVLDYAGRRVSLDPAVVGQIVIASEDRYGRAIAAINPAAGCTDNEKTVGVGKTLPRRDGGRVISDIVLNAFLFDAIGSVWTDKPTPEAWKATEQQALYAVCHEFGHARDHAMRDDLSEVADPRSGPFSIRDTTAYYGSIVLTEFAACLNAASVMTDSLFNYEIEEAGNRMRAYIRQVNEYLDDQGALTRRELAHTVCQGAWAFMVELAKLYGHATGMTSRSESVRILEAAFVEKSPLGEALESFGAEYPTWDMPNLSNQLGDLCREFAGCFEVRFVDHGEGPDDFERLA